MLGPHFYYDLIRLARKGWPTWLRVVYLVVLLVSLAVMYQAQGNTVDFRNPGALARYAHNYAYTLIVLQDILVLFLLPVYVASAVVEEKENRTLEPLFLTHLTDQELVLGKLGARVMHLGAVVFAGFPLLAYMHLWGNVDIVMLLYHEAVTFLLLLAAGSVCIWVSTRSESVFQAITNSYPWMFLLGFFGILGAFLLPVFLAIPLKFVTRRFDDSPIWYFPSLVIFMGIAAAIAFYFIVLAVKRMVMVRLEQTRNLKKKTASLSLSEKSAEPERKGKRFKFRSNIHPLALPVRDAALFWKECMKDGTKWSLTFQWFLIALAVVAVPAVIYRGFSLLLGDNLGLFRSNAYSFTYTSYFIALTAYVLVVVFQTTLTVAGEHEQSTLVFLLLIPEERRSILFNKWLGPLWRNWPILAIAYLGVFFGLVCGIYSWRTALVLALAPWPFLLMLTFLALWLSVFCRRVLFANIGMIAFLGALALAHIAVAGWIGDLLPFYVSLFFETPLGEFTKITWLEGAMLAGGEQALFLFIAGLCALLAFFKFQRKDYAASV